MSSWYLNLAETTLKDMKKINPNLFAFFQNAVFLWPNRTTKSVKTLFVETGSLGIKFSVFSNQFSWPEQVDSCRGDGFKMIKTWNYLNKGSMGVKFISISIQPYTFSNRLPLNNISGNLSKLMPLIVKIIGLGKQEWLWRHREKVRKSF